MNFSLNSCTMLFIKILIFLVLSLSVKGDEEVSTTVTLKNGNKLSGVIVKSIFSNKPYIEYRGIPYAKPPVGELRFKAPVPYSEIWDEIRDATTFGNACPQDDILNEVEETKHIEDDVIVLGSEDCLYINVATPKAVRDTSEKLLPVAVWIHGGSFQYESGDNYGSRKVLEHDIVYVTFNFRLGILGFLNSNNGTIQGNFGLKDQSLALKWVQEHISAFGGDPDMVTLMGVNSGAVSAHLHMLSPMSEGLFHRVILQSGTAIAPWAIPRNTSQVLRTLEDYMKCDKDVNLDECFMKADVETIIKKQPRFIEWFLDPMIGIGPSIEKIGKEEKFLHDDPYLIIASGEYWAKDKVQIIAGVNSHEGLLHSWDIMHSVILARTLNGDWERALPIAMYLRETTKNKFQAIRTSEKILQYYFPPTENSPGFSYTPKERERDRLRMVKGKMPLVIGQNFSKFDELTQLYSDRNFLIPLHKFAKVHYSDKVPLFLYWFDFQGTQSFTQFSGNNDTIVGVAHYDQLQYIFDTPFFKEPTNSNEVEFSQKFLKILTNFIKGEPTPSGAWTKVTSEMKDGSVPIIYNRIGTLKEPYNIIEPCASRVKFWDELDLNEYENKIRGAQDKEHDQKVEL